MKYYIMVNKYRDSKSDGFANTWEPHQCEDRREQSRLLREGLPIRDVCGVDRWGNRTKVLSTRGIRRCTPAERRKIRRKMATEWW